MKIEVHLHDGRILEFPDGTADAVIDRAVRQQLGRATPMDAVGEVNRMVGDTLQLARRVQRPFGENVSDEEDTLAGPQPRERGERYRPYSSMSPAEQASDNRRRVRARAEYAANEPQRRGGPGNLPAETELEAFSRQERARRELEVLDGEGPVSQGLNGEVLTLLSRRTQQDPQRYPWLFREGQLISGGEIADIVARSSQEIEGFSAEEAARYLFGPSDQRPQRRDASRALGMNVSDQPRFQRDDRAVDLPGDGEIGVDTRATGWDDRTLVDEQAALQARMDARARRMEVRRRRREALGDSTGLERFARSAWETIAAEGRTAIGGIVQAGAGLFGGDGNGDSVADWIASRAQDYSESSLLDAAAADPGYERGTPEYYVFHGIKGTAELAAALTVGAATRNPANTVATLMGARAFGQQFDDSRRMGRSVEESWIDGTFSAFSELVPEKLAIGRILAPGQSLGRRVAVGVAAEGAQEMVTETLQIGYDLGVLDQEMTFAEARDRLVDAGIIGGLAGGGIAAGAGVTESALDRMNPERRALRDSSEAQRRGFEQQGEAYREFEAINPSDPISIDTAARRAMERPDSPRIGNPLPPRADGRPRLTGIREAADAPPAVNPADQRSPLDTGLLAEGRRLMGDALASGRADELLAAAGAPATGRRVVIDFGDRTAEGVVIDGFETNDKELGAASGIRVRLADGQIFDEYFDTIQSAGISIREVAPPPRRPLAASAEQSTPSREAGALRDPDDILRGLNTQHTPRGGHRTPEMNRQVGGARRSDHLTNNARDIPLQRGMTKARLREAFEREGYHVRIVLGPNGDGTADRGHADHFHISYYPPGHPRHPGGSAPREMARADVSQSGGLDSVIGTYMAMTRAAESGGNDNAANPLSSARGRYQFLDGTWNNYARPGERRGDPAAEERIMRAFTAENAERLRRASIPISPASLYQAHHFGAGGAILMHRNPNAPLSAEVVRYNPHLRGKTNREALAWATNYLSSRSGGTNVSSGTSAAPSVEPSSVTAEAPGLPETQVDNPLADDLARPNRPAVVEEVRLAEPIPPESRTPETQAIAERVAREMAAQLLADGTTTSGFNRTGSFGVGQKVNPIQAGPQMRPGRVSIELENYRGQVFEFNERDLAPDVQALRARGDTASAEQTPQFEPASPPPALLTIEPTSSGKGLAITGATEEQVASIRSALPERVSIVTNKSGGIVVARKYEEAVRSALAENAARTAAPVPAASSPLEAAGATDIGSVIPASVVEDMAPRDQEERDSLNERIAAINAAPRPPARLPIDASAQQLFDRAGDAMGMSAAERAQAADYAQAIAALAGKKEIGRVDAAEGLSYTPSGIASLRGGRLVPQTPRANPDEVVQAAQPNAIVGERIDREWTRFAPASGTLSIARAEMPQIKAEHRGAMVNFLNARGVAHQEQTVPAASLKPTQAEFSREKIDQAKAFEGGDRAILVSSDGHVLDGHHQWMAKRDAGEDVRVIRLDAPIRQLLDQVREFPSATVSEGATKGSTGSSEAVETTPATSQVDGVAASFRQPDAEEPAAAGLRRAASPNTIFTEDAYEAAKRRMRERLNRANTIDPEMMLDGIVMAGFHIEKGARTFAAYAEAMIADLGRGIVPNLRSFYEAVRYDPRAASFAGEMSSAEDIGAALARLDVNPAGDIVAAEEVDGTTPTPTAASVDDRGSDATAGPADAPAAESERTAGGRPGRAGRRGRGNVRTDDVGAPSDPSGQRQSSDDGAGTDATAEPGKRGGDRRGRRVRAKRADAGADYLAPRGSLRRQGGWKTTAARNLDIIELVRKIEAEGRPATAEEQAELAKFTGWGASEIRNNLFPDRVIRRDGEGNRFMQPESWGEWKDLQARAAQVLKGQDLELALQSTQYAHYTSETVIRSMWDALDRLGFKGGKILEPGMGIGLFPVAAPAEVMADSTYTGIELDPFTARVAKLLLPQENALNADYVKQKLPNGFFDAAIGNPPFANVKVLDDPEYRKHRLSLHDYFFAKTIDKVRPGGLMVFVTSRYTMDKAKDAGRAYIAERADLIGAIRLPQTAFKENAGTEVVTDVLFLQRRAPGAAPAGEAWLGLDNVTARQGGSLLVNEYFARHPEMVLGTHSTTGSMYRQNEYTVEPLDGDIADHFAKAIKNLPEGVYTESVQLAADETKAAAWEADMRPASEKEGGLYVKDGKALVRENGVGVPVAALYGKEPSAAETAWLTDYAEMRDALKQAQRDQLHDGEWEASLAALNKAYDAFVRKHGRISAFTEFERTVTDDDGNKATNVYRRFTNEKLLRLDVESLLVESLEKISDDGAISKGPFLLGRTLRRPERPAIDTTQDALAVTLDELGKLDLGYVARLAGKTVPGVIEELGDSIYHVPGGDWQMADEYLSGDVLEKLEEAQAAAANDAQYERNVAALEQVQPKPLGPQDISIKLGAGWVPVPVVQKFAESIVGINASTLTYEPASAAWAMEMKGTRTGRSAADEFGTSDRSPAELLMSILNNQTIKVTRTERIDGSTRTWTDQEATAQANEAAKKMTERFRTWVWEDSARAGDLLDLYNRKFNNLAPRRFDGAHLTTPGLSANYRLYPHQKRAIWRQIQTGNVYLNHAVGAGKTLEMIVGGMEQRRLGLIGKPMYVVPNHMLNQFAREFLEAYPAANIMVADEKSFHTDNRRRFMAQAALNAPDAIVITHSSFKKIGTSDESRQAVLKDMIVELETAMSESDNKYTRSKIEKQVEALKRAFESKAAGGARDRVLTFEEMGVDYLFVDEAHLFRKLDFATSRAAKGIDPKGSQAAMDLYIKTRWLNQQRPGRSLALASGTPITNTMAEIYTVMRYMDQAGMERDGIAAFDAWANMFGEVAAAYEQNAAGGYEMVERFARFVNVPELMKRVRQFMDVLTSNDLGDIVKRPNVIGGGPRSMVTPPVEALADYMAGELSQRIETSRAWKPSKDEPANPDPIIAINTDARLASIDMRFIDPSLPSDPGSKLNQMIDQIIEKQREIVAVSYTDPKSGQAQPIKGGTQIVFSAVGFGEGAQKNRGFDLRGAVEKRLLKSGTFKKSEIAWIGDANTHSKKETLFKDMRAGRIKVLFGSPANMGTGVNVQNRLRALHFLSPPWYPADVEQPHGRIIRQGNWNEDVDLFWYATKGTYDSTAWGMVSRKARFIEQAMSGDETVRVLDDISEANQYEMASALAAGDERIIQVASLSSDIERLERLQGAHFQDQQRLKSDRRSTEFERQRALEAIDKLEKAVATRDADAAYSVTVGDATFDKPKEAGTALLEAIASATSGKPTTPTVTIGSFQGNDIGIEPGSRRWGNEGSTIQLTVTIGGSSFEIGEPFGSVEDMDPTGFGSRIANALQRLPSMLRGERQLLDQADAELAKIARKIGAPFANAAELAEKVAERAQLQSQLAAETEAADKARAAAKQQGGKPKESRTEIIQELTGEELGKLLPAGRMRIVLLRDRALKWFKDNLSGKTITASDGRPVILTMRGGKKATSLKGDVVLRAVPAIEALLTKGEVSALPPRAGSPMTAEMFRGRVRIGDTEYLMGAIVRTDANGTRFYDLTDVVIDVGGPVRTGQDPNIPGGAASMTPSIPELDVTSDVGINLYLLADQFNATGTAVDFDALRASLAAITGPEIALRVVADFRLPTGASGDYLNGVIRLALGGDPQGVGYHEAIHALRDRGVIRSSEWTAMAKAATADAALIESVRARYPSLDTEGQTEEAVADYFRRWMGEQNAKGLVRTGLTRLREFLAAVRSWLAGQGFTTADTAMRAIRGGTVGAREGAAARDGVSRQSIGDGGFADPAIEKRWKDASKGVGTGPGFIEKQRGWLREAGQMLTRHWKHLPNLTQFADLQQQLRKLEAAPEAATEEVVRRLTRLVEGMGQADFDLFNRKAVLDDLQWEAEIGHALPFGFTPTSLAAEKVRVDAATEANDLVAKAIRYRKRVNKQLADEMIEAGVLTREQIKNPAYYRHMVLQYARAEMRNASSGSKVQSPYWAKRMGSTLDINANLLEAEFDWMHKALVDIATARTIEWIKRSNLNIREDLRSEAKKLNKAKVAAAAASDSEAQRQDKEFRQATARGFGIVRDALKSGNLSAVPPHFQSAADAIEKGTPGDPPFAFLSWIMDNAQAGATGAAMILKASGQRKAWERKLLGKEWVDPEDMDALIKHFGVDTPVQRNGITAPQGFATWQPIEGRHLFTAKTIGESALDMFVSRLADTAMPGINQDELARALGSIRNQLVVGGDRYTMILPKEVVDQLNEYGDRRAQGLVGQLFASLQGAWKRWMLINPRRWFKYNLNNMTGDLDAIIAGNPGTFAHVPQAWRELHAVWVKKEKPSADFLAAQERGVFSAGMSVQEIPDINKLSAFRQLTQARSLRPDKLTMAVVAKAWRALQDTTNFREALFRYAAYLDYVEDLRANVPMKKIGYGASIPRMIDAVQGVEDKAGLLARDLIGDYGSISVTGGFLRRYIMPFWSWTEVNFRRYNRLIANAYRQGTGRGIAQAGLVGGIVATRTTAWLGIRMGMVYGAISIWNALFFGDEEDELGDMQKRQLHLILGRDSDGEIVTLRLQGAFSDYIGMLGFPDVIAGLKDWADGQGTIGDALSDMAKAPVNRLFSGISPFYTVPIEMATEQDYWPNLWEPRTIHDRWRHLAQTVNVENEYDGLMGNPTRGGGGWAGYGRSWADAFVYRRDPGEMAYDSAKGMAYDWLERARGREGGGSFSSPTGDALRLYRMAIRYGDDDAANRALDQYEAAGGTARGFQQSIARQHPLGPIAKRDRQEYLDSLTEEQYDTLLRAEAWYNRTFLQQLNDNERQATQEETLEAAE